MAPSSRNEISFFDLFQIEEIQEIQDAFALATGVASIITAPDGTPLTRPSNFCDLCMKIIRGSEEGRRNCIASDSVIGRFNPDGPTIRRCLSGGLWDAGASITVGNTHVANWLVGQVRDDSIDPQHLLDYADRIGVDRDEFAAALEKVPRMSRQQFQRVAESMFLIANQLSRKAYQTLEQREIIREKLTTEVRLKESESRFRTIFNSVNDAIFIHEWPSGKFVDVNQRATELYGYSREEILGLSVEDLSQNEPPYDGHHAKELLLKAEAGHPQTCQWRARAKSGELFWVEVSLRFAVLSGQAHVIVSVRDIADRRRAEAAALREQRFSDAVVNSVPGLLYLYDENARLVRWNKQHTALTGYSDEELASMHVMDWYAGDPATIERINNALQRVYREGAGSTEASLRTKSGERIPFFLTAVKLEIDGHTYFTGIGIDISERRRAEQALKESAALYRSVIENIQDVYYRTDAGGSILLLSPSAVQLLGYETVEDLVGTPLEALWKEPESFQEYVRILSEHGVLREFEAVLLRRDGSEVLVEATSNIYTDEAGIMLGLEGILRDIGKRRATELALNKERLFTDAVMESVPGLIYVYDSQGSLVRWNRHHVSMTGFSPEELLGRNILSWFGGEEPDTSNIIASIDRTRYGGLAEAEAHLLTKDGRSIPCLFTGARRNIDGEDYFIGMGVDISERIKTEQLLRESENKFASLFRRSPDAILLANIETGMIVDANEAFERLTGYTRPEIIGRTTEDLDLYADKAVRDRLLSRVRRDGFLDNEEVLVRSKDGRQPICIISSHVIAIASERLIMSVIRDITEFKMMQEMMIQTEKMISVGGIAAGIAHEINNPLGIIMQSAQLFAQRTNPQFPKNRAVAESIGLDLDLMERYMRERNLTAYVRDIREAANRAAEIIRHMLDFSRRSESKRKVCSIHDIIDRAITLAGSDYDLRKSFDFKKIRIERDYAENLPRINCTETEIEQVFLNLMRNAAQALGEASSTDPAITIRTAPMPDGVAIEIEDNGPGIPPEVARRIFEPFFTTKPPGQGTGLGLSVSFFIVTQGHGGSMSVRPGPGGACFRIELPRNIAEPETAAE